MRWQILLEFLRVHKNQSMQESYRRQILINIIRVLYNASPPTFPTKKKLGIESKPAQSTADVRQNLWGLRNTGKWWHHYGDDDNIDDKEESALMKLRLGVFRGKKPSKNVVCQNRKRFAVIDAGNLAKWTAGWNALRSTVNDVEKWNYWVITFYKSTFNLLYWCS